jgi:hypothetical protein
MLFSFWAGLSKEGTRSILKLGIMLNCLQQNRLKIGYHKY